MQRLGAAGAAAAAAALLTLALVHPRPTVGIIGVGLGTWLVAGALVEAGGRVRLSQAPLTESWRRLATLPRGSWGMTLAHLGLGLFVMGAAFEAGWRVESAAVLAPGGNMSLGAYRLQLENVSDGPGPNYDVETARILVTDRGGRSVCQAAPERRTYDLGGQTTSKVALCPVGLDDVYVVAGERRAAATGSVWLIRSYLNPWIRLVFLGPLLMALGGALSLSDRRLRIAGGRRRPAVQSAWAPAE
jgi:cytochrome c-type biogenesis protein CcmF